MDPLTIVAGFAAAAGVGTGWHWRRRGRRAEVEVGKLRGELLAERHAASHDPLTGLPNRRAFYQLGTALVTDPRRHHLVAAIVDLDDFKQINDRYGHAAGDEVLINVARRFATYAGDGLVARLGGDEFAGLLITATADERWLHQTGERLAVRLAAPMRVAGSMVVVTASVGLFSVVGTTDLTDVLRHADAAMYRAKARHARTGALDGRPGHHPETRSTVGARDSAPDAIAEGTTWLEWYAQPEHAG